VNKFGLISLLLLTLCLGSHIRLYAIKDTTLSKYQSIKIDSLRIDSMLSDAYNLRGNSPRNAYTLAWHSLEISLKIKYTNGIIDAYNLIGSIKNDIGEFDAAMENHLNALNYVEKTQDTERKAATLSYLGNTCLSQNLPYDAIGFYQEALTLQGQQPRNNLYKLGWIYETLDSLNQAYKFYKRSLLFEEEQKNDEGVFFSLLGIGSINAKRGNFFQAYNIYNDALEKANKMKILAYVALCYSHMGDLARDEKRYVKAREYYIMALDIADSLDYKKDQRTCYLNLARTNENLQFYNDAYYCLAKYVEINDTLFSEEANERIVRMQIKLDLHEKEKEIEILKEKDQRSSLFLNFTIVGLGLLFAVAFLLLYLYRIKRRSNNLLTERNLEIEQQKEEIITNLDQLAVFNKELENKNRQITDSILYASTIQSTILPGNEIFQAQFPSSFIIFKPRDIVSGDFYWMHQAGNKVILALADCTGHGVAGAFMSMIGYTLLNGIMDEGRFELPSQILERLNQKLKIVMGREEYNELSLDDGMEITICIYDKTRKSLQFAAANQNVVLASAGASKIVDGDIYSIGGTFGKKDDAVFRDHTITVSPGTMLYLFSDGFQDQFGGPDNSKFMLSRLVQEFGRLSTKSTTEQEEELQSVFKNWMGENRQTDDVLVIGIQF
jgi:serine phosphatase RsbU (regulator of sigma subunit)